MFLFLFSALVTSPCYVCIWCKWDLSSVFVLAIWSCRVHDFAQNLCSRDSWVTALAVHVHTVSDLRTVHPLGELQMKCESNIYIVTFRCKRHNVSFCNRKLTMHGDFSNSFGKCVKLILSMNQSYQTSNWVNDFIWIVYAYGTMREIKPCHEQE